MASEDDSNSAMARLLESLILVETELEGAIQRLPQNSDTSIESKSGEAGVWPVSSSILFLAFCVIYF